MPDTNTVVTITRRDLAQMIPYAHKDVTRYAMNGVAVYTNGAVCATNGKIISRIGKPEGEPVVIPTKEARQLVKDAKAAKREADRVIEIQVSEWGIESRVTATVREVGEQGRVIVSREFPAVVGHFPPAAEVYTAPKPDAIEIGLDLALLERIAKAAVAGGKTAARFTVSDSATGVHIEIRSESGPNVESIIMPLRL